MYQRQFVIGALYHPPKPSYKTAELMDYVETCVDTITKVFPEVMIVLAGDFNALDDITLTSHTGLNNIVTCPTRGDNILDRVYVNDLSYATVRIVTSTVKSDHKAVVASTSQHVRLFNKARLKRRFRKYTLSTPNSSSMLRLCTSSSPTMQMYSRSLITFIHLCTNF